MSVTKILVQGKNWSGQTKIGSQNWPPPNKNSAHPIIAHPIIILYYILRFWHTVSRGEMERDLLCGLKLESENFSHGIKTTHYRYLSDCLLSSDC